MGYEQPLSGAQRVARRRAVLRAQGLRPRTFWLPDSSNPDIEARARADSIALGRWYAAHPGTMRAVDAKNDEIFGMLPPEEHDY